MGGQQKVVKTLQAVIGFSGYGGCEKQLNAFGTEHPGGRITAFEGCCPTKPKFIFISVFDFSIHTYFVADLVYKLCIGCPRCRTLIS